MLKAAVAVVLVVVGLAVGMYAYQSAVAQAATRSVQLAWMLDPQESLAPDSRAFDVLFIQPDCGFQGQLSTNVEYDPHEVAVGLLLKYEPGCLISGGPTRTRIVLSEPLGDRQVVPLDQPNLTQDDFPTPATTAN